MDDNELRATLHRIETAVNVIAFIAVAVVARWFVKLISPVIIGSWHWGEGVADVAAGIAAILAVLAFIRWMDRRTP